MNANRKPCFIDRFEHDGRSYTHYIYTDEFDQIELQDDQGETIIEFTADCLVKDKNGALGEIRLEAAGEWVYYENPLRTRVPLGKDLLKGELEISKRYLASQKVTQ